MNIFLIFNFSANLAIIFDFADASIVFHEYAGACSRPACRARTSNQMTDIAAGGQSAIPEDDTTYFSTVKDFILNVISD